MDKLTALVIIAISFMALYNVSAWAQNVTVVQPTGQQIVESYTGLIGGIATAIGTIGSIIGVIVVFIKDRRTREIGTQIGVGMSTFGQKTGEILDKNAKLAEAFYKMAPEDVKKFLIEHKADATSLSESVRANNEQLKTIEEQIGGKEITQIRTIKRALPHESFDTRQ